MKAFFGMARVRRGVGGVAGSHGQLFPRGRLVQTRLPSRCAPPCLALASHGQAARLRSGVPDNQCGPSYLIHLWLSVPQYGYWSDTFLLGVSLPP